MTERGKSKTQSFTIQENGILLMFGRGVVVNLIFQTVRFFWAAAPFKKKLAAAASASLRINAFRCMNVNTPRHCRHSSYTFIHIYIGCTFSHPITFCVCVSADHVDNDMMVNVIKPLRFQNRTEQNSSKKSLNFDQNTITLQKRTRFVLPFILFNDINSSLDFGNKPQKYYYYYYYYIYVLWFIFMLQWVIFFCYTEEVSYECMVDYISKL